MANNVNIHFECAFCSGTGTITPPSPGEPVACPYCAGTGNHLSAVKVKQLEDTLENILDLLDGIKAKTDTL